MSGMYWSVPRLIVMGQLCFYVFLVIAILLKPAGLAANDGISYFGIYKSTFLPYAASLLGSAYFSIQSADRITNSDYHLLAWWLQTMALLSVGIVITPYAAGHLMDYLHTAFGSILFAGQLLISIWLTSRVGHKTWPLMLTLVELIAGIASAIYLRPTHGFLLQAQVVFQAAFGGLLLYFARKLPLTEKSAKSAVF